MFLEMSYNSMTHKKNQEGNHELKALRGCKGTESELCPQFILFFRGYSHYKVSTCVL